MGKGIRTDGGRALPTGSREGEPSPGRAINRESMSLGIRNLILAWGEGPDQRDDDERLAAVRMGSKKA